MKTFVSKSDKNILPIIYMNIKKIGKYRKKIRKVLYHTAVLNLSQYNKIEIIESIDHVIKEIRNYNKEIVNKEHNNNSELSDITMLYNILEEFTFEYEILYDIYNKFILKQQYNNKICKYLHKLRKFSRIYLTN
jgi:hypothetical protein